MYSLCLEHCIGARPIAFHRSSAHFIPKLSRTNYYRNSLSSGEISSSRSTKMFTRRTECTVDKFIQILDGYSICAYECVCVCVYVCVCVCVCVCTSVQRNKWQLLQTYETEQYTANTSFSVFPSKHFKATGCYQMATPTQIPYTFLWYTPKCLSSYCILC